MLATTFLAGAETPLWSDARTSAPTPGKQWSTPSRNDWTARMEDSQGFPAINVTGPPRRD